MHFAWSITCFSRSCPEIAPVGQFFAHLAQPIHLSVISNVSNALQERAVHFLCLM
jgi:hypothetical protein